MDFTSSDSVRNANPLKYLQEIIFNMPLAHRIPLCFISSLHLV